MCNLWYHKNPENLAYSRCSALTFISYIAAVKDHNRLNYRHAEKMERAECTPIRNT